MTWFQQILESFNTQVGLSLGFFHNIYQTYAKYILSVTYT